MKTVLRVVLRHSPPEPPAEWLAEAITEARATLFTSDPGPAVFELLEHALIRGWRKGWRGAIEHAIEEIDSVAKSQAL